MTEYPENARDNGYWLFKYIREKKPEQEVYYPIKKNASDYIKVKDLGNTVEFGSLKHCVLYWASSKFIGTTKYHGFPDERICAGLFELKIPGFKYVFLNHGFARGHSNIVDGEKTSYDLIIAMSEKEKEIMLKLNHQTEDKVKAIGFCRQDNLWEKESDGKTVLIMPTWRRWLDYRHQPDPEKVKKIKEEYWKSDYYKEYQKLINNTELEEILEKYDLNLLLYPHGYAQEYLESFHTPLKRVKIVGKEECFIQDLLKEAIFLITDYSSVCCDYAYMKKPMVYFQFDKKEFAKKQYAESEYFTYEKDGFGPIVFTQKEVLDELRKACENNFKMGKEYCDRVEKFYGYFGHDHCEKTYQLIKALK